MTVMSDPGSARTKKVFLSSTSRDLHDFREAVSLRLERLDHIRPVAMETFGARTDTPAAFSVDSVQECDLLVGIIGDLYGSCPPDCERSFTEMEYDAAVEADIPRLMFLSRENSIPLTRDLWQSESREGPERLKRFRARIEEETVVGHFSDPVDLAAQVIEAIRNWELRSFGACLVNLGQMVREDPEVARALGRVQEQIRAAADQIDVVADYKALHDELHGLERSCFNIIVEKAVEFPSPSSLLNLRRARENLKMVVSHIQKIVARGTLEDYQPHWLDHLEGVGEALGRAIESQSRTDLDDAAFDLNHVLATHFPEVNTQLITAARSLPMTRLLEALQSVVGDGAGSSTMQGPELASYRKGLQELEDLRDAMRTAINAHDAWQQLERDVRMLEGALDADGDGLRRGWSRLNRQLEEHYQEQAELAEAARQLQAVLEGGGEAGIREAFFGLRWTIGTLFFEVDLTLKELCETARGARGPLYELLAVTR